MPTKDSIELTDSQIKALSEISRDIGQVAFASMVVSPFLVGIDNINWVVVISGLLVSFVSWFFSIFLVKKVKT